MNELDVRRHRIDVGRQRQREQIAADREQHVVLVEHLADIGREPDHGAAKQRMRGRKRRRARHEFGVDGRAEEFRKLDQFGMSAALRHRVAGHDHRTLGVREQRRGRIDRRAIAAQARRDARGRKKVDIAVGAQDVAGQRQEYRPGRRRHRGLGGAVHEPRQIGEAMHLGRPFDERPRDGRKVGPQNRLGGIEALLVLTGGHENGRACLLRVVEHAHGVAQAGRDVEIDHCELARRLRIAVRHRHDGRFLQAQQVAQLVLGRERIHQRQFGGAGIAEHDLDALLLQNIEEGALSGHDGQEVLQMLGAGERDVAGRRMRLSDRTGSGSSDQRGPAP